MNQNEHSGLVLLEHLLGFLDRLLPLCQVLGAQKVDILPGDEQTGPVIG